MCSKRLAAGEGVEPSSSSSKPDVLPVTPSRKKRNSGHWDSNPEPCANLALTPLIRRLLYRLSYAPSKLVAVEGIEPTSLDYQSSALAVGLHREKVAQTSVCVLLSQSNSRGNHRLKSMLLFRGVAQWQSTRSIIERCRFNSFHRDQTHCRFAIANCRLPICSCATHLRALETNRKSAMDNRQ